MIALAHEAMDAVRRDEMREVRAAMGTERKTIKGMFWGMRRDHAAWSEDQRNTMYRLQRSNLKNARAWRPRRAARHLWYRCRQQLPRAGRSCIEALDVVGAPQRLEPFKKLATTLKERLGGVVRGMLDGRSNAYVEAMNGRLQQVKRAARGFRTVKDFVAITYLLMSKLQKLPYNPMREAAPLRLPSTGPVVHFHYKAHRAGRRPSRSMRR